MNEELWQSSLGDGPTLLYVKLLSAGAAQLSSRIWSAQALLSPPHCFSLQVVSHPPGTLSPCGLFSNRSQDFFLRGGKGSSKSSEDLGPEPMAASFPLKSCCMRKMNSWIFAPFCWGILFCGWVIPFGDNPKTWLIGGLKHSPSVPLVFILEHRAFLG